MDDSAYLVLEDGMVFEGKYFGAPGEVTGEVVFNTGMTGYVETLTDKSYYGQIVLQTFPLIGNYGVIPGDFESYAPGPKAYIVRHPSEHPSNFRSEGTIDAFLKKNNITGLCGIDTRALTKIIRGNGVMNGRICAAKPNENTLKEIRAYRITGAVKHVTTDQEKYFEVPNASLTVALLDFGLKDNIRREINRRGCSAWVLPAETSIRTILDLNPDGIVLSNGPGDPAENTQIIKNIKEILQAKIPVFGICLGHQLLALANGFSTHKMKYGHRGSNQPVKDMSTGRVYITSQNHGYAVTPGSIDKNIADEWFINVNDNTCEGLMYKDTPVFSVQFHPEASGGPRDTAFLFDCFIRYMEDNKNAL